MLFDGDTLFILIDIIRNTILILYSQLFVLVQSNGAHLYETCPSGNYFSYYAQALGSRCQSSKTYLEKSFKSFEKGMLLFDFDYHSFPIVMETHLRFSGTVVELKAFVTLL
tara:strand:- start:47 stop:379 length:333 start_codon:yes stop_codon:yes gene_type:complete